VYTRRFICAKLCLRISVIHSFTFRSSDFIPGKRVQHFIIIYELVTGLPAWPCAVLSLRPTLSNRSAMTIFIPPSRWPRICPNKKTQGIQTQNIRRKEVNWVLEFSIGASTENEDKKKRQRNLLFWPLSECVNMPHRSVEEACRMCIVLKGWEM
jgi:hypothetical protein